MRKDILALRGVGHLGMELNTEPGFINVRHAGNRTAVGLGNAFKIRRQLRHLVAMTHPDIEQLSATAVSLISQIGKQPARCSAADLRVAKLRRIGTLYDTP